MKHWLRLHWLSFTATLRYLVAAPMTNLLNIMVISLALSLPLTGHLFLKNIKTLTHNLPAHPQLTIFMHSDASQQELGSLKKQLKKYPGIHIRYIGKEEGLKTLAEHSKMTDLLEGLSANPLPDAFVVTFHHFSETAMEKLSQSVSEENGVESVVADTVWVKRLNALLAVAEALVNVIAIILGASVIFITGNSIRMQILTRQKEIAVSKLIGATDAFIRRPFLYFSVLQGILGGLFANGMIEIIRYYINPHISALATLYNAPFGLVGPDALSVGLVCLLAAVFCWIGAYFSVWRHLRQLHSA